MRHTPLSAQDRRAFETDGFLIVRAAISPEQVARLEAAGDAILARDEQRGRATGDDGRRDTIRNPVALDPTFLEILAHPTILPMVVQLMSPNLQLHTSHYITSVSDPALPSEHRAPGWHRDLNTCPRDLGHHAIPRLEIKVAYQLSDARMPEAGTTMFVPGSHLADRNIAGGPGDPPGAVAPTLAPGDAVLFENRTFHAGGVNRCGHTRKSLMYGYSYWWMKPDDDEDVHPAFWNAVEDPYARQLLRLMGGNRDERGHFHPNGTTRPLVEWARKRGLVPGWEAAQALGAPYAPARPGHVGPCVVS